MVQKTQQTGQGGYSLPINEYRVINNALYHNGTRKLFQGVNWVYRVWYTTPNWKSIMASNGWLPTQPYRHDWFYMKRALVSSTRLYLKTDPRQGWYYDGRALAMTYSQMGANPGDNSVSVDAQSRCLVRARNMRVNMAVAVAEGRKTVDMLLGTVKTLGRAYGQFRRGRFGKAAKELGIDKPSKSSANNWLAYQYGWKPLISDAVGFADTLREQYSSPRPDIFRCTATARKVLTGSFTIYNHGQSNNHGLVTFTDVTEAKAGLLLEVSNRGDQFRSSVGLSITDIGLTAWELVPFSFVFDWFVNVGQYLDNISALTGMSVKTGWVSYVTSRTGSCDPSGSPQSLYYSDAAPSLMTRRSYTRTPWSGSAPTPRWNGLDGLGLTRLITTAALFRQQYRNDRPIGQFRPKEQN